MWESVATELGLSLQPITGKPGRIRGDLDGFRVEVDIASHTSGMLTQQRAPFLEVHIYAFVNLSLRIRYLEGTPFYVTSSW